MPPSARGTESRAVRCGEAGFTLIELLIVVAIVGILSAIAMAGYRHVKITGAETAALTALRAINQAQFSFAQTCGDQRYSPTLAGLGIPAPGTGQAFLSPDMTADPALKSGYRFVMGATVAAEARQTCNGLAPAEAYQMSADPITPGLSGIRYFGTNTDKIIFADTATFAENMPERGAPGHGTEVK